MNNIGYVQIVKMTDEKKIAMHMRFKKIDLSKMLLGKNKYLERIIEESNAKWYGFDGIHQITNDMDGCSSSTTTYESSDCDEDNEIKPGIDCAHLCHDCKDGAYCWDSECNDNKNS